MSNTTNPELSEFLQKFKTAIQSVADENHFRKIIETFAPLNDFHERCYKEEGGACAYIDGEYVREVNWHTIFAPACCTLERETIAGDYISSLSLHFKRETVTLENVVDHLGSYRWDLDPAENDIGFPVAYFDRKTLSPNSYASVAAVINAYDKENPLNSKVELVHLGYYDDRYDDSFPL